MAKARPCIRSASRAPWAAGAWTSRNGISAFATAGDRYTLTIAHRRISTPAIVLPRRGSGLIFNGKDGSMLLDIPLYSARAFTHRAIMMGDDTSVTVEQWGDNVGSSNFPRDLRLRTAPGFPQHTKGIQAVYRDTHLRTRVARPVCSPAPTASGKRSPVISRARNSAP
ncbi:MAG: hypothetical protein WDN28_22515 [Chthoniobacter sp.]